eukprot:RCo045261
MTLPGTRLCAVAVSGCLFTAGVVSAWAFLLRRKRQPAKVGEVSFWFSEIGGAPPLRPGLSGSTECDVCIVGAGFTGLWTALYLSRANPSLSIVIVEQAFAGYGASGRNGGWLAGEGGWPVEHLVASHGVEAAREFVRTVRGAVSEVISQAAAEGFSDAISAADCLTIATNPAQQARLLSEFQTLTYWGESGMELLDAAAVSARVAVPGA